MLTESNLRALSSSPAAKSNTEVSFLEQKNAILNINAKIGGLEGDLCVWS
jgi:hypothetical protein